MTLYACSYVKNMKFRTKLIEDVTEKDIEDLKQWDININYITKVAEDDPDIKKALGILKRTKKLDLKNYYANEIEIISKNLGNKPKTVQEFFCK